MVVSRKTNRRKTFLDELYLISRAPGKYFVRETISAIVTPRSFFLRKIYALKCKALRYSVFGIPPLTVRGAECMGGASIRARVVQKGLAVVSWTPCLGYGYTERTGPVQELGELHTVLKKQYFP